jgi:hypothetical protein
MCAARAAAGWAATPTARPAAGSRATPAPPALSAVSAVLAQAEARLAEAPSGPVHVHDLQATILHQLGFNHEKLTYRFQGRDFRLTDVHGTVVREIVS